MISRNTVLVLGAGASKPYGFPIGLELVDQICAEILDNANRTGLRSRLANRFSKNGDRAVEDFARALRQARAYSIDRFLETRAGFQTIGKAAIADVLLRAEGSADTYPAPTVDWYRYLLDRIAQRDTAHFIAQAKRLSIITFNFDRSFEQALFSMLSARLGLTEREARHLATCVDIHHVHGTLGAPAWLYPDQSTANPYGVTADKLEAAVAHAVDSIKNIHDDIDEITIEDLQVPLGSADFVYFIGFGFDQRNLERIGVPTIFKGMSVVRGTTLGLTEHELRPAVRLFNHKPIHFHHVDALTFMRSHAEALFT
jgi:hypothetical protein